MNAKKWVILFFTNLFGISFIVFFVNYMIDPLWIFSHHNKFNNVQSGFNERIQKTNKLYFDIENFNYNGILLGSSRSTYINQNEFYNMKIFNYSSSYMFPQEYRNYINFSKEIMGKDLDYIIIGVDFFGTNIIEYKSLNINFNHLNEVKSFFYKYKVLFSIDNFKNSLKNIYKSLFGVEDNYYNRDNIKFQPKISELKRQKLFIKNLKKRTLKFYDTYYKYDTNYINILKKIKIENPNTKFIIFTSAITSDLLVSIMNNANRLSDYEKWLKDLIEVFGEINHFMTVNTITMNLQNYIDSDHAYPEVVNLIANKLSNTNTSYIPDDFGIILNKYNLSDYINQFKIELQIYKSTNINE